MTEGEFLSLHTLSTGVNINTPFTINVNYDGNAVGVPGAFRTDTPINYYILGLTVTRNAKSVDGIPDVNLFGILEGVEKIRFSFDGFDYSLDIISRHFYPYSPSRYTSFFYFRTVPFQIPSTAYPLLEDPESQLDTYIDFSPFINDLQFVFADYNARFNNAQAIRSSEILEKSDRKQNTAAPSNFEAIYNGTAEPAEVQDSLYSDTGWSNARYNGTKTSADNYAGLLPSITGRAFQGEVYSANASSDVYCNIQSSQRIFEELFQTGPTDLPTFTVNNLGIYLETLITSGSQNIPYVSGSFITGSIESGDILVIDDEKIRVLSVEALADPPYIRATRGYVGTIDSSHIAGTEIYKVDRTDIFRFTASTTKSATLDNSIVYVSDSNTALYTDIYGTVYSSSLCPQVLYFTGVEP